MSADPAEEPTVFLSDAAAGRAECRFAGTVIAASAAVFLLLALFAKVPLAPLPAFIPIYQSALIVNDLITASFLLGQSQFSRSNALGLLAGGYLFTALMSTAHALTFPGVFSPTGLLDAGPQTTAWLYIFWHGGFPLFVIGYAIDGAQHRPSRLGGIAIVGRAGLVLAAAGGLTALATAGQRLLPAIMAGDHYKPLLLGVVMCVWTLNVGAVLALSRRKPYSLLDLWLIAVMCAWLFDIALSTIFNAGRYDLGFYAGRVFGLLAASFVLIMLLVEQGKLYGKLAKLRDSDRAKAAELHRLSTTDQLTAIANRRAFEDALGQEWRRTLRHDVPLSLLLIDVDYFKRFNDTYGHVAGDRCLREVAQAVAGRARRAGEMAARYGGEEFAVLLPHSGDADAKKLAELICATVRERRIPHSASEVAPYVTVSIGVASISGMPQYAAALSRDSAAPAASPPGATVLIEAADQALYRAKMSGRNRVATSDAADASEVGLAERSETRDNLPA
jgi:diguanylate cyclase (GGDEF)-like protein